MSKFTFIFDEPQEFKSHKEEAMDIETHIDLTQPQVLAIQNILTGQTISNAEGFIIGHGTYQEDNRLIASVSGNIERINKWISVRPPRSRYRGDVGDVVVGRITEVLQKSWKVDIQSKEDAILQLSSINLPGGILRRRTTSDELQMRQFFCENDVISAEIQQIYAEGSIHLHTRNLKYGKLANGFLISVPSSLIKNVKNHFYSFPFGIEAIIGRNGSIWLTDKIPEHSIQEETQTVELREISVEVRENLALLGNCALALAQFFILISPEALTEAFYTAKEHKISAHQLLQPEVARFITQRLKLI